MPTSTTFVRPVVIETNLPGRLRRIGSAKEAAEYLLRGWPELGRGKRFLTALEAFRNAVTGEGQVEPARKAFIAAAKEVGIFVREAEPKR
jgi:hypothetical protein